MIPTVRREIADQWIEAYLELKHKTKVDIRGVLFKYQSQLPGTLEEQKRKLAEILTPEDDSKMDDALILGQIKAWSFGDVTQKVLDEEVSENKRMAILAILGELYPPFPAGNSESLPNNTTVLSSSPLGMSSHQS